MGSASLQVLTIICLSAACVVAQLGVDLTLQPETAGTNVVLASIGLIEQAGIFPADNRLLRRVAYAETRDGVDITTYRPGYNGGIWQVDENIYNETQNIVANPQLTQLHSQIFEALGISWPTTTWVDLRRPLFSALAARLFFSTVSEAIPMAGDLVGQGEYWKRNYNSDPADTAELFVDRVNEFELEECPIRGLDLAFVLDSSGSVGVRNFALTLDFAANLTRTFSIGPQDTQVAAIAFSGFPNITFLLNTFTNRTVLEDAIRGIQFFDIPGNGQPSTYTAAALNALRFDIFSTEAGARPDIMAIPRVAVVVTDGRSNVNRSLTIPTAMAVRQADITVFAVGVGNSVNREELDAIGSGPNFVSLLTDFNLMEFQSLQRRLSVEACVVPAPIDIEQTLFATLDEGQVSFLEYQLPTLGMTLALEVQEGSVVLYASNKISNPNAAFYDYRLETSRSADVYINASVLEGERPRDKRQLPPAELANITVFVTLEGLGDTNTFELDTTIGDTTDASPRNTALYGLVLLLCLLGLLLP